MPSSRCVSSTRDERRNRRPENGAMQITLRNELEICSLIFDIKLLKNHFYSNVSRLIFSPSQKESSSQQLQTAAPALRPNRLSDPSEQSCFSLKKNKIISKIILTWFHFRTLQLHIVINEVVT